MTEHWDERLAEQAKADEMKTYLPGEPGRNLTPIEEQTSHLDKSLSNLEHEIQKLEGKLFRLLTPLNENTPEPSDDQAVPIRSPFSPLVNELGSAATYLARLTNRLALLNDRIEL